MFILCLFVLVLVGLTTIAVHQHLNLQRIRNNADEELWGWWWNWFGKDLLEEKSFWAKYERLCLPTYKHITPTVTVGLKRNGRYEAHIQIFHPTSLCDTSVTEVFVTVRTFGWESILWESGPISSDQDVEAVAKIVDENWGINLQELI